MSFLGIDGFKKFCQLLKGDLDKKSNKENPVFTGSLSQNRLASSTIGTNSTALGYSCTASGNSSHSEGNTTTASGEGAHSEGKWTKATGICAHAEGSGASATSLTSATGTASHAEGYVTFAYANYSHAEGKTTKAQGEGDHSEGVSSKTSNYGTGQHAEGYGTTTTGGYGTHVEGYYAKAGNSSYYGAHAEGHTTMAYGDGAHSEGKWTSASGQGAHAEGQYTTASGDSSHAAGYYTTALQHQYAIGHYNDTSLATAASSTGTTGTLFVIGNGNSTTASNAVRITGAGAVIAKAAYQSTGADYAEWQEWADGNPDEEDRRGYFVVFDGDKIRKATSEDKDIVGVVSANPCIIGNNDDGWRGIFLMDAFGDYIYEEVEVEREEIDPESGETITVKELTTTYKVNPDYDPDMEYIHRKDRKEWDCIGFMGMLITRSDGTCQVNKRCKPNDDGKATLSDDGNGFLVLSIDEENQLAKVLIGVNVRNW